MFPFFKLQENLEIKAIILKQRAKRTQNDLQSRAKYD